MTERKKLDGKGFARSLSDCKTEEEVFGLLGRVLGPEKMRDRAKNVSNIPQIVKLEARKALLSAMQGKDTSNQDCMNMAADRYLAITGKKLEQFKAEVNKHATGLEMRHSAERVVDAKQKSVPDHTLTEAQFSV